jgi:tRNA A37 threonylcarbamoyladenosine dehydratase
MQNPFERSELILGSEGMERLTQSTVAIFGVGGVGSFAAEVLARTGIGEIILIDYDIIDVTNINRQIHATSKTIGMFKVEVMRNRLLDINPNLRVKVYKEKYNLETKSKLISAEYDYVIDAIDMVSSKLDLIVECKKMGVPIISCMGAGNKLNPTMLQVGDIHSTKICPLAKIMRKELRKRNVEELKVVWSEEEPKKINLEKDTLRKAVPGSIGFVPSVAGLIIGSEVIKDIAL